MAEGLSTVTSLLTQSKMKRGADGGKKAASTCTLPWAKGFHPPNLQECTLAIFVNSKERNFKEGEELLVPDPRIFQPIPRPTCVDDWLHQYPESTQTARDFADANPWLSSRPRKGMKQNFVPSGRFILDKYPDGKIYIAPLGSFSPMSPSVSALTAYTSAYFQLPCVLLPEIELEERDGKVLWGRQKPREVRSRQYARGPRRHHLTMQSACMPDTHRSP